MELIISPILFLTFFVCLSPKQDGDGNREKVFRAVRCVINWMLFVKESKDKAPSDAFKTHVRRFILGSKVTTLPLKLTMM